MKGFERRLAKLERVITGQRMYVLIVPAGMSSDAEDAAIAAAGIKPRPCDLVVLVQQFSDQDAAPELVHVLRTG